MERKPEVPSQTAESPLTIVIVEDDFMIRWNAADYLRELGYTVIEAVNASEAINIFVSGTPVDMVFSDINMPGALSGHGLAKWLELNHPHIPLLLTSSDTTETIRVAVNDKRRFIAKPYALAAIEAHIESMCR